MKRWAFLIAAASVFVVGCGGGGGGNGGGGGGGGGLGPSINLALFNKPGRLEVTYDTGQGRVPGSQTAIIRHFYVQDNIGLVESTLQSELRLQLDGYTSQGLALNPSMGGFSVPIASRLFSSAPIEVAAFEVEQGDGSFIRYNGPSNQPIFLDNIDVRCRTFPGRTTILQIFLDDATLYYDEIGGAVVWDRQRFEDINYDPFDQRMNGFISDYIMLDISNVANKPQLTSSVDATRVYFSGDLIALSVDPVQGGADMEVLTPLAPPIEALVSPPSQIGGQTAPGTYTLRQIDPRDLNQIARITALQGIWRPYNDPDPNFSMFLNVPQFFAFTLPHSDDDEKQEILILARDLAGNITDLYFGEVDFAAGTFAAWPIENVDDGSPANEINGTVSNIVYRAGVPSPTYRDIRSGTFTITVGTIPATFQTTGTFIVGRL